MQQDNTEEQAYSFMPSPPSRGEEDCKNPYRIISSKYLTEATHDELISAIEYYRREKQWDELFKMTKSCPALLCSNILLILQQASWEPDDKEEYRKLINHFVPCRSLTPLFDSGVNTPVILEDMNPKGIQYYKVSSDWKRILTVKAISPRFDKDEIPSDDSISRVEIFNFPDGVRFHFYHINTLISNQTVFYTGQDLSYLLIINIGEILCYELLPDRSSDTVLEKYKIEGIASESIAVDEEENRLFYVTKTFHIAICDLKSGFEKARIPLVEIFGLETPDNERPSRILLVYKETDTLVLSLPDGRIAALNIKDNTITYIFSAHRKAIDMLALSNDGRYLFSSSGSITRGWNLEKQQIIAELIDPQDEWVQQDEQGFFYRLLPENIRGVVSSPLGNKHILLSHESKGQLYSVRKGDIVEQKERALAVSQCMIMTYLKEENTDLIIQINVGRIDILGWKRKSPYLSIVDIDAIHVDFDTMNRRLFVLELDVIHIINLPSKNGFPSTGKTLNEAEISIIDLARSDVSYSRESLIGMPLFIGAIMKRHEIFIATDAGLIYSFVSDGNVLTEKSHFSVDGKPTAFLVAHDPIPTIAVGTEKGCITLYDIENERVVKNLLQQDARIISIALSPKENFSVIWTAMKEKEYRLYADPFYTLSGKSYNGRTQGITCHPTNEDIVVIGDHNSLRFWNFRRRDLKLCLPVKDRPGKSSHKWEPIFTPTGYHLLYLVRSDRLFFLDPRAYILKYHPVSEYQEEDFKWLRLQIEGKKNVQWASFLNELNRYILLSPHEQIKIPIVEKIPHEAVIPTIISNGDGTRIIERSASLFDEFPLDFDLDPIVEDA